MIDRKEHKMTFEEKTISSEMIYEGKILNLRRDKVTTVDGTSYREIIEHNGAVCIAAITDSGNMVMVKQYRKPLERVVLEVPAGKIDGDEEPLSAAIRELKEETGYEAKHIQHLSRFYPSVAYCKELIHLFLCTGLVPGETHFDDNEAIDIEEYSIDYLYDKVMKGELEDAKTLIAILTVKALQTEGKLEIQKK